MASINTKLQRAVESEHWMTFICYVKEGMLFVDFESHQFPDADLRKVKHHIDCHLREAIEDSDAKVKEESERANEKPSEKPAEESLAASGT
jgi:hypothetical protein